MENKQKTLNNNAEEKSSEDPEEVLVGAKVAAPFLQTSGTDSKPAEIVDSTLTSLGTKITIHKNGKLKLTGDAKINQS